MNAPIPFDRAGRLPAAGDNVAIASRRLNAGTVIERAGSMLRLPHTILEGHRFSVFAIPKGAFLNSWNLPFGIALRDIAPGEYVCNARILEVLRSRHVDFPLPGEPNFENYLEPFVFSEQQFTPGRQVPFHSTELYFQGYARGESRGVGTRNCIVVLGTSSRTASIARTVAERLKQVNSEYPGIDAVVAVAHTEGGGAVRPNNETFVLRALAGWMVHPNVGAVLAIDQGTEPVNNERLRSFLAEQNYPIDDVRHRFVSAGGRYAAAMAECESVVRSWLAPVNACVRSPQPVRRLRVALQCGGSDAFSGVSGNPLAGWVAKEVIRYGGSANLAETDELMGAEAYVLRNVRDLETARHFLEVLERFRRLAGWHGHDAEGNPSGGNNYRGLYNIAIKSIGAARKKDPDVRLDYVIDYAERMREPGFYFMDSPGNDLESIAGQVASGCNLILFTTGNGSITNFPFVPTIKIMTNTGRYELLRNEMDVNAGRYQDGTPMDLLGTETFELAIRIASGERSAGERAGHSQVQVWREWRLSAEHSVHAIAPRARPSGRPLAGARPAPHVTAWGSWRFRAYQTERGPASRQVALIVPTSLCSGQIARCIADQLNQTPILGGIRAVALPHTEGCGVSGGECEELLLQTLAGYLVHPFTRSALLLEHGCEKTHNDAIRNFLSEHGMDWRRFGWASIQLDGGIEKVGRKVMDWFAADLARFESLATVDAGLDAVRIALTGDSCIETEMARALADFAGVVTEAGGTVVVPENAPFLRQTEWLNLVGGNAGPTLRYGETFREPGLHVMSTPTDHHVETVTGLGATGVELVLAVGNGVLLQGHPLVPVFQVAPAAASMVSCDGIDIALDVGKGQGESVRSLMENLAAILSGRKPSKAAELGNTDFQMTRGVTGISL